MQAKWSFEDGGIRGAQVFQALVHGGIARPFAIPFNVVSSSPPPNFLIPLIQRNLNPAPNIQRRNRRPHAPLALAYPIINRLFRRILQQLYEVASPELRDNCKTEFIVRNVFVEQEAPDRQRKQTQPISLTKPMLRL
jgi:hypothetical protein